jgi:hypothetical protein
MTPKTAADILGTVILTLTAQIALGQDDACGRCGTRLSALYAIYLADCGRYCSRTCAEAHAAALLAAHEVMHMEAFLLRGGDIE